MAKKSNLVADAIQSFLNAVAQGKLPTVRRVAAMVGGTAQSADVVNAALDAAVEAGAKIAPVTRKSLLVGMVFADRMEEIYGAAEKIAATGNRTASAGGVAIRMGEQLLKTPDLPIADVAKVVAGDLATRTDEAAKLDKFKSALKALIKSGADVEGNDLVAALVKQANAVETALAAK